MLLSLSSSLRPQRCPAPLLLFLTSYVVSAELLELGDLKRCFERYDGHKLSADARPYHSEWRRQNEEQCLEFCVKSASRCASIVYDKSHHICHYFGIKDLRSVQLQRKFVYLRVADETGGTCMESMRSKLLLPEAEDESSSDNNTHQSQTNESFGGDNNSSATESSPIDKSLAPTIPVGNDTSSPKGMLDGLEADPDPVESGDIPTTVASRYIDPGLKKPSSSLAESEREIRRSPRIDDQRRRQMEGMEERHVTVRHQKPNGQMAKEEEQWQQADEVQQQQEQGGNICEPDSHRIWLAVENARVSTARQLQKDAGTPRECLRVCANLTIGNDGPCNSFTFSEHDRRCSFAHSDDQFPMRGTLEPIPQGDFSQRAFRQFCYPVSLSPFEQCAEFLAFTDYRLDTDAREIFDGLPAAAEGLSACIELCVLSSEFHCMSASFDAIRGVCRLFTEHSLSEPNAFREHQEQSQLYFENGCAGSVGEIPEEVSQRSSVQRMDRRRKMY